MHPAFRLAGLALEAEAAAIRARTRAAGRRVGMLAVAVGFGVFALGLIHLAAWQAMLPSLGEVATPVALAAVDLAIAGLLILLARRTDGTAEAAERTRDLALAALRPALTSSAALISIAGLAATIVQGLRRR
jgi:hypothetical protein